MTEKLSAFIDHELSELEEHQLLRELGTNAGLRATWDRYHVMRLALNRQLEILAPRNFPEQIQARLDADPTRIVAGVERGRVRASRFAASLAIAASIAAIAIVSFQAVNEPQNSEQTKIARMAPPAFSATPVVATAKIAPSLDDAPESPEQRIQKYIVGHNELVATGSMGGMLSYVRVVARDRE